MCYRWVESTGVFAPVVSKSRRRSVDELEDQLSEDTLDWLTRLEYVGPDEYNHFWDDLADSNLGRGHYARTGEQITLRQWAILHSCPEYVRVSITDVAYASADETEVEHCVVSTVWMGIDHSFGRNKRLIFETMVFGGEYDEYQERYITETQAIDGHERIVRAIQARELDW
jgi:hypothetical protein